MPVVTRRRGVRILLVVAAGVPLLLAGGAALLTVVMGGSCSVSGVGDAPSRLAVRDIPGGVLRIYEQVGAQFRIPWEVLAGIGKEECDHGRNSDPSCTPQPGARGPGVANCCGASGPMQIGVGGASGDNYDSRCAATCPIRRWGRTIRPRRSSSRRCTWSSSAMHPWASRSMRTGRRSLTTTTTRCTSRGCWPTRTPTRAPGPPRSGPRAAPRWGRRWCPASRARILPSGDAAAPADAPVVVREMIAAGNRIDRFAYSYGGAHGDPAQTMNQSSPDPGGGARAQRRTAARGMTAPRPPTMSCTAVASGESLLHDSVPASTTLGERGGAGSRAVGHDLRQRRPRLHRGRRHLPRHGGGAGQPAEPAVDRSAVEHGRDGAGGVRGPTSAWLVTAGDSPAGTVCGQRGSRWTRSGRACERRGELAAGAVRRLRSGLRRAGERRGRALVAVPVERHREPGALAGRERGERMQHAGQLLAHEQACFGVIR